MGVWQEADLPVQSLEQMTVEGLHSLHSSLRILDVRDQGEWEEGHIEGATHMPYYFVEQRLSEFDATQPLAVLCASGQRSTIACSILQQHGFKELFNTVGGMNAWNKAGFDTVTG